MTTDKMINDRKTNTLKKGDKVVMHSCIEAKLSKYKDKIWTCLTPSYLDINNQEVVFLEGFSGCFATEYLTKVKA